MMILSLWFRFLVAASVAATLPGLTVAQSAGTGPDTNPVAFRDVILIDGTGSPARTGVTVVVESDRIVAVGDDNLKVPANAQVIDGAGKTLIPGLVATHNHLHHPRTGFLGGTAATLNLAAGVTTMSTAGSADATAEILLANAIEQGQVKGPQIMPSGPYFSGPGGSPVMVQPKNVGEAADAIEQWASRGSKWIKLYRHIPHEIALAITQTAHAENMQVAAHLCSLTFEQASDIGIDAIEHGFTSMTDFYPGKQGDQCPQGNFEVLSALDIDSEPVEELVDKLVDSGTALSITPAIFESSIADRTFIDPRAEQVLTSDLAAQFSSSLKAMRAREDSAYRLALLRKAMDFHRRFFLAGGLLTAGTDPGRHVLPGFGDQRNVQILMEFGFSPEDAIQVASANGSKLLKLTDRGTIAVGKRADLVLLDGDITSDYDAISKPTLVMRGGQVFHSAELLESIAGQYGAQPD